MKILNLGSLNFDKVYDVPHFAESGETILSLGYSEFLGGKGLNQSLALVRAGAEVYHAGAVGPDGVELKACLDAAGVNTGYLQMLDTVSGHAIIQKCQGNNCIIVCGGANQKLSEEYIGGVLDCFGSGDILLLQNEVSNVTFAIGAAKARGMKVIFNASPINEQLFRYPLEQVDCFIINEIEGKALSECKSDSFTEILDALVVRYPNAEMVMTLGDQGVMFRSGGEVRQQSSFKVEVADTTAAGDTFLGYYLAGEAQGLSVEERLERASGAAAIAVSRNGASASIPTADELEAFLAASKA